MADYKINKTNGTVEDGAGYVWKLLIPNTVDKTGGVGNIGDINSSDSKFIKKILDSFIQWLSNKFRGWIGTKDKFRIVEINRGLNYM